MPADRFVTDLNQQIGYEFSASQQYIAVAVYYDDQSYPQLASFFYRQALEERDHAMMMVQYLLDAGAKVNIPGVSEPQNKFKDIIEPVKLALEQEQRVSDQIAQLTKTARDEGDFLSEQFMQWFLKEQVEEVSTMSELLTVIERSIATPLAIEDYIAREHGAGEGEDLTAPTPAGSGA